MIGVAKLRNTIQEYPWGSRTALAELLGRPVPSLRPEAELWIGAHPRAPSLVLAADGELSLADLIGRDPRAMLGPAVCRRFDGRLPFLFKVLAAAEPLSIQAHPDLESAHRGFADENARGIALGSPERSYADDNHKPEVLCALTRFHALSGFRDHGRIIDNLTAFDLPEVRRLAERRLRDDDGLAGFFAALLAMPEAAKRLTVSRLEAAAGALQGATPEAEWVLAALEAHPGDLGAVAVLLLNLVELAPGEALYQDAGVLHAYLRGVGIELMANSDNVLRCGLTSKRVDRGEILRVVDFRPAPPRRPAPVRGSGAEEVYPTPAAEFRLSRLALRGPWTPAERSGIELWIATEGSCAVTSAWGSLSLRAGESFVVPGWVADFSISGEALLFRAIVPPVGSR